MAIVGTNSTNVLVGAAGWSATLMWATKTALIEAGWRLMSCGTGTGGTYTAPDPDEITSVADPFTLPSDLNANGAWFRIKEPGTTTAGREYIFQRGDAATKINVKYSRVTGFTHGSPNLNTAPTTGTGGDGVSLFSTLSDSSVTAAATVTMTFPAGGYVQAVASDAADANGVWSFYAFDSSASPNSAGSVILYQDGLLNGSAHPMDQDPSYRGIGFCQALSYQYTINPNILSYWDYYGTLHQIYRRSSGASSSARPAMLGCYANTRIHASTSKLNTYPHGLTRSLSVYDGKIELVPLPVGMAYHGNFVASAARFKGITSGIMCYMTAQNYYDVFNVTPTKSYISIYQSNNVSFLSIAVPWVPNVTPLV